MNFMASECRELRGARASCALVLAFRQNELSLRAAPAETLTFRKSRATKVRSGGTPLPTRRMRALPGAFSHAFTA